MKLKFYCGSEFNSASTTTLVKSTRSMLHFFWYRKWPSEASNHQNFPLRGLHEGCALSGARNIFIALGAARQKCRFLRKLGSKVPFSQGFAGLHPLYRRAGPLTPKNLHGVTPGPGVREYGAAGGPAGGMLGACGTAPCDLRVCSCSFVFVLFLTQPPQFALAQWPHYFTTRT